MSLIYTGTMIAVSAVQVAQDARRYVARKLGLTEDSAGTVISLTTGAFIFGFLGERVASCCMALYTVYYIANKSYNVRREDNQRPTDEIYLD